MLAQLQDGPQSDRDLALALPWGAPLVARALERVLRGRLAERSATGVMITAAGAARLDDAR